MNKRHAWLEPYKGHVVCRNCHKVINVIDLIPEASRKEVLAGPCIPFHVAWRFDTAYRSQHGEYLVCYDWTAL